MNSCFAGCQLRHRRPLRHPPGPALPLQGARLHSKAGRPGIEKGEKKSLLLLWVTIFRLLSSSQDEYATGDRMATFMMYLSDVSGNSILLPLKNLTQYQKRRRRSSKKSCEKGEGVILPSSFCRLPFCLCHIALESLHIQVIQP